MKRWKDSWDNPDLLLNKNSSVRPMLNPVKMPKNVGSA